MIKLEHITLELPVDRHMQASFKTAIGGELFTRNGIRFVKALNDITALIEPGDRIGVIGRNGSGKSSLLRLLANIYQPSLGTLQVEGKVSTLFTNSLGLYLRETGRRNVELGVRLLGLQGGSVADAVEEIIEFTELGDYIDVPMIAYSAGMRTRLGFAIATQIRPDILLVDEVFGAGDMSFVNKAMERMEKMMEGANILILASHSASIITRCCNKALWLNQGKLQAFGDVEDVMGKFDASVR
ncbi:MAG: ATP-binding cassette domain-containing protein [Pseudomonadota bacterium]